MKNKIEKIKDLIKKRKEKVNPKKRAAIKLGGYAIFFTVLIILAKISANIKENNTGKSHQNQASVMQQSEETYREKQRKLKEEIHNITIEIKINENIYKINGKTKNNEIDGYFEDSNEIKKIKIKNKTMYEIKSNDEIEMEHNIDLNKIDIENLLSIFERNSAYIDNKEETINYQYSININDLETKINVYSDIEKINKITITDINSEYIINFEN